MIRLAICDDDIEFVNIISTYIDKYFGEDNGET